MIAINDTHALSAQTIEQADNKIVNFYVDTITLYSYICDQLAAGRSGESIYTLIESLFRMVCPCLGLDLCDGNIIEICHEDAGGIEGDVNKLVEAIISDKFKNLVMLDLEGYDYEFYCCIDEYFI